jgi:hypothetical protein
LNDGTLELGKHPKTMQRETWHDGVTSRNLTVAAIYEYVPSKTLAVFLQVVMLAAVVGIFLWLR